MGEESGGESLEDPIELQSGEELSELDREEFARANRWLDEMDNENSDEAAGEDDEGDEQADQEEPEESTAKRPRVGEGPDPTRPAWLPEGYPTRYRGGPPQMPDGSTPPPEL